MTAAVRAVMASLWLKDLTRHIIKGLLYAVLGGLVVVLGVLVYWSRFDTLAVTEHPISDPLRGTDGTPTVQFTQGQSVMVPTSYCLGEEIRSGIVRRVLVSLADSSLQAYSNASQMIVSRGCPNRLFIFQLPSDIPLGWWVFHTELTMQINPMREIKVKLTDLYLEVLSGAPTTPSPLTRHLDKEMTLLRKLLDVIEWRIRHNTARLDWYGVRIEKLERSR